tara:strand:+ start:1393 stop:1641 length:249 start_codon:yes stop_codon:yes gene_type:complete
VKSPHELRPFPSPFTKAHRAQQRAHNAQMAAILGSLPIAAPVFTGIDMGGGDGTVLLEVAADGKVEVIQGKDFFKLPTDKRV